MISRQIKIVIDDKIPYINGAFEGVAESIYISGSKITAADIADADVLITRTRTICNSDLLSGSSIKFIATATIGHDHIDATFCRNAGIEWTNAPGCNSGSVMQYVASALLTLASEMNFDLRSKTIGIVGVGNVGSKVAQFCKALGINVLLNDPPRAKTEESNVFCTLETICEKADIITFHTPLISDGELKTYHLVNADFIQKVKRKPILINSARGEIIDSKVLKQAIKENTISGAVIDCWENEPDIDLELLSLVNIATPHIAGYSKDGKANGTEACVRAISRFFGLGLDNWSPKLIDMPASTIIGINGTNKTTQQIIADAILSTYTIKNDDNALRYNPSDFEALRGDYPTRREFMIYTIKPENLSPAQIDILRSLNFTLEMGHK